MIPRVGKENKVKRTKKEQAGKNSTENIERTTRVHTVYV